MQTDDSETETRATTPPTEAEKPSTATNSPPKTVKPTYADIGISALLWRELLTLSWSGSCAQKEELYGFRQMLPGTEETSKPTRMISSMS